MRSDNTLLIDIVEHARLLRERMARTSRADFDADPILRLGIAHALQIIGEATRTLSDATRRRFPGIPWSKIVGMRHRLVHEYFRVDPDRVWDSATADVLELLRALEPVVQPLIDGRRATPRDLDPKDPV